MDEISDEIYLQNVSEFQDEDSWDEFDLTTDQAYIKQGYLYRRTKNTKKWKRRWFVLRDVYLMTYQSHKEYQIEKILNLGECQSVVEAGKRKECPKKPGIVFGIVSHRKIYYLMSEDEDEMKIWVDCIRQQMQLAKERQEDGMLIRMKETVAETSFEDSSRHSYLMESRDGQQRECQPQQSVREEETTSMNTRVELHDEFGLSHDESGVSISYPPGDLRYEISSENDTVAMGDLLNHLELTTNHETIRRQGYVEASSDSHRRWKKFWAVLRNNALVLYKDEREYRVKKIVYVTDCKKILAVTKKKRPYVVQLETSKYNYFFSIESVEEQSNWLAAFSSASCA